MVDAYQTLEDRDNRDDVEASGPFICTRADAWLGDGFYLWDTNIEWAKEWGINSYERKGRKYLIGKCQVDTGNKCFDLVGTVAHQMELIEVIEALKQSGKLKNYHRLVLPNIIQYLKSKGLFDYNLIRAGDITNKVIRLSFSENQRRQEYMLINQRVQICVIIKKDVILPPFRVIYPEIT